MPEIKSFACDVCGKPILRRDSLDEHVYGVIIEGNIYAAEADGSGELIGNNIHKHTLNSLSMAALTTIDKTILCTSCLLDALMADPKDVKRWLAAKIYHVVDDPVQTRAIDNCLRGE